MNLDIPEMSIIHSQNTYDRVTGAGFVTACNGQYADALSKGMFGVSLLVAETTVHVPLARSQPRS